MKPVNLTAAFTSMGISEAMLLWVMLLARSESDAYTKQLSTYNLRRYLTDRNRHREKY